VVHGQQPHSQAGDLARSRPICVGLQYISLDLSRSDSALTVYDKID